MCQKQIHTSHLTLGWECMQTYPGQHQIHIVPVLYHHVEFELHGQELHGEEVIYQPIRVYLDWSTERCGSRKASTSSTNTPVSGCVCGQLGHMCNTTSPTLCISWCLFHGQSKEKYIHKCLIYTTWFRKCNEAQKWLVGCILGLASLVLNVHPQDSKPFMCPWEDKHSTVICFNF